jgi:protease II
MFVFHKKGRKLNKMNSFYDFIDCAVHFARHELCDPSKVSEKNKTFSLIVDCLFRLSQRGLLREDCLSWERQYWLIKKKTKILF